MWHNQLEQFIISPIKEIPRRIFDKVTLKRREKHNIYPRFTYQISNGRIRKLN